MVLSTPPIMAPVLLPLIRISREYLQFLTDHKRLIGFGFLVATLSGFGQTFFIGLFNPQLRATFALSHGEIGLIYGAATLTSAVFLTYVGRWYDRTELRYFLSGAAGILAAGCALMASASSLLLLFLAMLFLRHGGQGLMGHISQTTMASYFTAGRGKALSIASMGFTLAEGAFPPLAVTLLAVAGWRIIWWLAVPAILVLFLPFLLWLLRDTRAWGELQATHRGRTSERHWTVREAVLDKRFLLITPAAVAGPLVVTVIFFHVVPLAAQKGWSLDLMALGLSLFAAGHLVGLLGAGPLIDRFRGIGVITPSLLPMIGSFLLLAVFEARWNALVWPLLLGLGMGVGQTAVSALLAELYGRSHLGGIRAVVQSVLVVSTAAGPPAIGWVLDRGISTEQIALGFAAGISLAAGAAWVAVGRADQPGRNVQADA